MRRLAVLLCTLCLLIGVTPAFAAPGSHSVSLSWTAPTAGCTTAAPCTYNVYRATTANICSSTLPAPYATGVTTAAFTDNSVTNGQTYFYDITAVGSGGESACSNEVQAQIPVPPGAPTGLNATIH